MSILLITTAERQIALFKINRHIAPHIEMLGEGQLPLIVIDDYIEDVSALTQYIAQQAKFSADGHTQYPGIRSPMTKDIVLAYLKPLMQPIYKIYGFSTAQTPAPCDNYFSLITTAANELTDIQTIPHFDTYQSNLIAVIHYLNDKPHGGIGFFRHKRTGYEFINELRKPEYDQVVNDMNLSAASPINSSSINDSNNGSSTKSYCSVNHSEFECYKTLGYKANRLIVFPGMLLHSSLVDVETDIDSSPQTGRLTANIFIKFV
ncbi:DUF6445 family protein [Shewanella livingstonensis]|uniref:Uncharacterized protein n=1 Tax=Shewanella livingstonensis TaxID=150120 RepID=A0A3G8LUV1_9GAMM|nr:DUF6445 family protein [Shewanella livingstonensis]AZG73267.1 hypothetical protein EGC82_11110 [Shewanella livingstonensis]